MARHAHDLGPGEIGAAPRERGVGSPHSDARRDHVAGRRSERSCIVTRAALPPDQLIRFVLSPQAVVTPDIRRVLPGRGVWVTASRTRVAEACRRKVFARAFKKEVTTPADLADDVGLLLRKDALQALSLANKAGALTAGFEKTRAALESGGGLALLEASDGSPEGRKKLIAAWRRGEGASGAEPAPGEPGFGEFAIVDSFASLELDLALGRPHVIHAALLRAPAGGFALTRCLRLHRFELIEKHASGGAERCGAARESRNSNRQSEPPTPSLGRERANRAAGQQDRSLYERS
jgi:predicted RNA-binding protein YlxR (DUF448 family)